MGKADVIPGDIYYAEFDGHWWRVKIQERVWNKTVLVKWLAGPLSAREARLDPKTLKRKL